MPDPTGRRWPFWTAVTLIVLVLCPLSIGPVFWALMWLNAPDSVVYWCSMAYRPLTIVAELSPPFLDVLTWYVNVGNPSP